MSKHETTPNTKKSNKAIRDFVVTGVAATGLAGAAILGIHIAYDDEPSKPSAMALEQDYRDMLKSEISHTAQDFATRIIDATNHGGKDRSLSVKQGQDFVNGVSVSYTDYRITTPAELLLGEGDFGEYMVHARVRDNGNDAPNVEDVESVIVTMDLRNRGEEQTGPYGGLYSFSILRIDDDGQGNNDWRIVSRVTTKAQEAEAHYFTTENNIDYNGNMHPLTLEDAQPLIDQAKTVMDWSDTAAPVNYPPIYPVAYNA